jgi:hypothetical protein
MHNGSKMGLPLIIYGMPEVLWKTKPDISLNIHILIVCIVSCAYIVIVYSLELSSYGTPFIGVNWAIPHVCGTTCLHD